MAEYGELPLRGLVADILRSYEAEPDIIKLDDGVRIDPDAIRRLIDGLRNLVFAGFYEKRQPSAVEYYIGELLEKLSRLLQEQVARALRQAGRHAAGEVAEAARQKAMAFLARIPWLRSVVATDVEAALDGDPAAASKDEIILSYPGLYAVTVSRLAHELYLLEVPLIPRMMTEHAHGITGIDIHPGASLGHHFFIDHGTGVVIGETTEIGDFVKIYQGVTLGALSTRGGRLLAGVKRHPTIRDHVTIYSGASIFGGSTVIGEGVVIGSNAFITKSVPEKTRVSVRNPELQFKSDDKLKSVELEQDEFWSYEI
ncbi:MAG: serine acetyltransferase [Acidobacteriota bacterium]|jgi:serine O-acetyltransferase|nr:serine acetyltransferase [Acidobacteriota bacterium]